VPEPSAELKKIADGIPQEWRAPFLNFVQTRAKLTSFPCFADTDKACQDAIEQ